MIYLKVLSATVAAATFFACGIISLAVLMTISMSRSGPSLGEAIAEFWPIATGLVLSAISLATFSFKPKLALGCAAGGAASAIWLIKMLLPQ
ncbi:hypothetical protein AQZ52_06760 [Novosphingobium fuchskuhlense]|uniref:Uncharacterized protein n=1 Tax=Novosphingobium fuchskuhlense TaxID=1117702 RepID=A0A117UXX7_9SPHN|nr:hypothetical protein [Novosphingobium fuchskuhlense]KUR72898.1 hypothetical protein AQZ52_06760 [Novosphingobium fuchskuhlense]